MAQRPTTTTTTAAPSRPAALVESAQVEPTEPNVGRTAAIGAAIGFVVVSLAIGLGGTAAGMGALGAFGMGAMVGVWGGAGFGFMLGGTVPFALYLDAEERAHHSGRPTDGTALSGATAPHLVAETPDARRAPGLQPTPQPGR